MTFKDRFLCFFFRNRRIIRMQEQLSTLEVRRNQIYSVIEQLEEGEKKLLQQGKDTKSMPIRRRLANQLFHLRQDLKRQNAIVNLINKRITIFATDIHNVSIVQEGKALGLTMPDIQEMTEHAVEAEEMVEQINENVEMAVQFTEKQDSLNTFDEYEDIMAEFEEPQVKTETLSETDVTQTLNPSEMKEERVAVSEN